MSFGPLELVIILVIVFLLFGTKRLKNLGGDLGGAIKGFKKSMSDEKNHDSEQVSEQSQTVDVEVKPIKKEEDK